MINYNELVEKYDTPMFIYNIDVLRDRINYLKSIFKDIDLIFAVKANTFIVKEIEDIIDGYEICSYGEYQVCDRLDIKSSQMIISGVNKDDEFVGNIFDKRKDIKKYTIESLEHYKLLNKYSLKHNIKINALIRLTSGNQFGVSEEDFLKIINEKGENIHILGIQYFSGTQNKLIKRTVKEIEYLNTFIDKLNNEYNFKVEEVEYGPGLPIVYFEDNEWDENKFLNEVYNELTKLNVKHIAIEVGRSIVAGCGLYLTRVVDLKSNQNGNYVILDGGINHLVYYGQMMAMKKPRFEVITKNKGKLVNYNLCGSLCTINDILLKNVDLNELSLNDLFIFKDTGAYSSTEGINLFLTRNLPKVVLYKSGRSLLVRDNLETSKLNFPNYERK